MAVYTQTQQPIMITVYCDGSCLNNGSRKAIGGIGVYFENDPQFNLEEGWDPTTLGVPTNQRTEIQAAIRTLETIQGHYDDKIKSIDIYTDSDYVYKGITSWMSTWKKCNWKTYNLKQVKNQDLWGKLDTLIVKLKDTYPPIKWHHVFGHQGIRGNEEADKLAQRAASLMMKKKITSQLDEQHEPPMKKIKL